MSVLYFGIRDPRSLVRALDSLSPDTVLSEGRRKPGTWCTGLPNRWVL